MRRMSNENYNNYNNARLSVLDSLSEEGPTLMVGIKEGVDCTELRGGGKGLAQGEEESRICLHL
jgi:hypothetical protein